MSFSTLSQENVGQPTPGSAAWVQDICADPIAPLQRLYHNGGDFVSFGNGSSQTLFAFAPDYNRTVFNDPNTFHMPHTPGPRGSSQRRLTLGLFALNGEKHLLHRRLLMPALTKGAVESYFAPVAALVQRHLGAWQPGQVLDVFQNMRMLALKLTGEILFGLPEFPQARAIADAFQHWMQAQVWLVWSTTLPVQAPADAYQRLLDSGTELEKQFRAALQLRREIYAPGQQDLLGLLLHAQDQGLLREEDIIGEMHTLVNAAYQTTASALTWTLFMIAQHPEVARGLVDELGDASQSASRNPQAAMPLMERVIKESMRILPPVAFTIREACRPGRLGEYDFPERTVVILSFYVTHHMPHLFDDPEAFRPDRWLTIAPSPYAYMPYGAGPRMCMGAAFSQQMLRVTVGSILRRFRLTVVPGSLVNRHCHLTLGLRQGLPVELHELDRRFSTSPIVGNIHEMVRFPDAVPQTKAAA